MNSPVQTKVVEFLEKYELLKTDKPFIVAFSGGYDSLCLLDILLHTVKNKIIAIHLNHGWRGEESDSEELNCKNYCIANNITFYSELLDKNIPHTETDARNARYKFFEKCADKFNTDVIFTAHNANDNLETIIYRITKGTGLDGLCGILEQRDIYYRPLLNVERKDIEMYCKNNNLTPNSDSSNSDTKYKRNLIRHKIIPELMTINKDVVDAVNSLSQLAIKDCEYLNKIASDIGNSTEKFLANHDAIRTRVIKDLLTKRNVDYDREKIENLVDFIVTNANSKSGKVCSVTTNTDLYVNNKCFEIITHDDIENEPEEIKITHDGSYKFRNGIFTIESCNKVPEKFPLDNEAKAYISISNVNFMLRTRQNGDIIKPLGSSGYQKLKKYLNEKKIPQHKKDTLPMLANNNEILWVAGVGLSDKIKVTKNVTHKIKFEWEKNDEISKF